MLWEFLARAALKQIAAKNAEGGAFRQQTGFRKPELSQKASWRRRRSQKSGAGRKRLLQTRRERRQYPRTDSGPNHQSGHVIAAGRVRRTWLGRAPPSGLAAFSRAHLVEAPPSRRAGNKEGETGRQDQDEGTDPAALQAAPSRPPLFAHR